MDEGGEAMSGICGMCVRRECIRRDDDRYQCDKYLGYESIDDSHEKLEADVRQRSIRSSTQIDCTYDDVMRWLDRQAAITERECVRHQESLAQRMIRDGYEYEIWELRKRIKELTAERDELNATLGRRTGE